MVDASGNSTLGNVQAGSMGEAWSDWYALDFLVGEGFERDTATPGELIVGKYVEAGGQNLIRTQPLDCPVGASATACPGTPGAGSGGYATGTSARSSASPRSTPTARSGARRSGTCARRSGSGSPSRW